MMHQEIDGVDIGDRVEVVGANAPDDMPQVAADALREYDGSEGVIVGCFSDSRGVKCATVKVASQTEARTGKRYFPTRVLKKLPPKKGA